MNDAQKMTPRKKLIEVALPLEAINKESLRRKQKSFAKGFRHPFTYGGRNDRWPHVAR